MRLRFLGRVYHTSMRRDGAKYLKGVDRNQVGESHLLVDETEVHFAGVVYWPYLEIVTNQIQVINFIDVIFKFAKIREYEK